MLIVDEQSNYVCKLEGFEYFENVYNICNLDYTTDV